MTSKLAIRGGAPVISGELPLYRSVGKKEIARVTAAIESGCLSGFYGSWGPEFLGGPLVREFEAKWAERFKVKHAVSVNSATSGLFAAIGAIGITAGDEVIVPPLTMSATVMAPLIYGGIPVFADVDPDTFCLDPAAVKARITKRTKAIFAVDLFGQPAHLAELRKLADAHGIKLLEDCAQAPLATEQGRYAGTWGHIGIYSLNYHKHFHTGEGGMCVTDDPQLATRLQMIRNHGENCVEALGIEDPTNLIGWNYRMTEMSAAVGLGQLEDAEEHVHRRVRLAKRLSEAVSGLEGITAPKVRPDCSHVYYLWAAKIDEQRLGVSRETFSKALAAEGFPHFLGYLRPLYYLPVFRKRVAFGAHPFNLSDVRYDDGLCPVAERLYAKELLCFETCMHDVSEQNLEKLAEALQKVHRHRGELA